MRYGERNEKQKALECSDAFGIGADVRGHTENEHEFNKLGRLHAEAEDIKPAPGSEHLAPPDERCSEKQKRAEISQIKHPTALEKAVINVGKDEHSKNAARKIIDLMANYAHPVARFGKGLIIACRKQHNNAEKCDGANSEKKQKIHSLLSGRGFAAALARCVPEFNGGYVAFHKATCLFIV